MRSRPQVNFVKVKSSLPPRFCVGDPGFNCVIKSEGQPGHDRGEEAMIAHIWIHDREVMLCHSDIKLTS